MERITCRKCGKEKPADAFNWYHKAKGRRQDMCRACFSEYNRARYLRQRDTTIERTRRREREQPRAVLRSRLSAWSKKPTHINLYRVVHAALAADVMVRPDRCEKCGKVNPRGRDGRHTLHAHHPDHMNPFEVEWLCVKCHAAADRHKWAKQRCPDCGRLISKGAPMATHRKKHAREKCA